MQLPPRAALLILIGMATAIAAGATADWMQWRGPSRDGTVPEGSAWPAALGKQSLVPLWEIPLGEGYSGPVMNSGAVFALESRKDQTEAVQALDRKSGEVLWEASWPGSMKVPFFARKNGSWVRSTPSYDPDSGLLFAAGMRDVLVAIDARSGDIRWQVDFAEREGTELPAFGFVSSPLVVGPYLYVQAGCAVTKLDKLTGKTVWRALEIKNGMFGSAFSSVILEEMHGRPQIIAQTRTHLAGLDPDSGSELWKYEVKAFRGMNILTPTRWGDSVFTATYGGGSFLFSVLDLDTELQAEKTWAIKTEGYMSSPVVVGDHVYLLGRDRHFHCLDLQTGETAWSSEEKFGEYWSIVRNGGRALALDQKGELLLLDLNPSEFRLIGRAEVSAKSPTWAHLAVSGDEIYVRSLKDLKAFRWEN